ncbi:hypothetical protein C8F01DRAFT_1352166 [Mycena amicta]|nr:hypothetical protein C8F01DRAFT_1352166 [Mycena amicta]
MLFSKSLILAAIALPSVLGAPSELEARTTNLSPASKKCASALNTLQAAGSAFGASPTASNPLLLSANVQIGATLYAFFPPQGAPFTSAGIVNGSNGLFGECFNPGTGAIPVTRVLSSVLSNPPDLVSKLVTGVPLVDCITAPLFNELLQLPTAAEQALASAFIALASLAAPLVAQGICTAQQFTVVLIALGKVVVATEGLLGAGSSCLCGLEAKELDAVNQVFGL